MKSSRHRLVPVSVLLVIALTVAVAGCFGGGDESSTATTRAVAPSGGGSGSATTPAVSVTVDPNAELSTFRSKDPFIPQALPATTTTTKAAAAGGSSGSTATTSKPVNPTTITVPSGGGAGGGGSTSSTSTPSTSSTSTTAPHIHSLRILAATQVGGAAAVTFQVDGSVYKDRRVGDVVSTSWGQIKVLDVNTASKVVTLLQGSETLVLSVGQLVYQ
jgi:hypothetical protein